MPRQLGRPLELYVSSRRRASVRLGGCCSFPAVAIADGSDRRAADAVDDERGCAAVDDHQRRTRQEATGARLSERQWRQWRARARRSQHGRRRTPRRAVSAAACNQIMADSFWVGRAFMIKTVYIRNKRAGVGRDASHKDARKRKNKGASQETISRPHNAPNEFIRVARYPHRASSAYQAAAMS